MKRTPRDAPDVSRWTLDRFLTVRSWSAVKDAPRSPPTNLFTLRLWLEPLVDDRREWRGEVKHLFTGEARFFRR